MPRGGRRQGKPGSNYANRSDLQQGPRQLPVTTAPGQTYGEAGQQAQAQQAVPMGNAPLNSPATAPQPPMGHADVMQAAQGYNPPPVVPLTMPTLRPGEPVTAGMGQPAAAPQPLQSTPVLQGVALLNSLGSDVSPAVKQLRAALSAAQGNQGAP